MLTQIAHPAKLKHHYFKLVCWCFLLDCSELSSGINSAGSEADVVACIVATDIEVCIYSSCKCNIRGGNHKREVDLLHTSCIYMIRNACTLSISSPSLRLSFEYN